MWGRYRKGVLVLYVMVISYGVLTGVTTCKLPSLNPELVPASARGGKERTGHRFTFIPSWRPFTGSELPHCSVELRFSYGFLNLSHVYLLI